MKDSKNSQPRVAAVYGSLPSTEEIDQYIHITENFNLTIVSSDSIIAYLTQNSFCKDLKCIPLPDHDEDTTYLPGLEKVLVNFDIVIVKERLGVYAYQAVKAKWKSKFRLIVYIDNLMCFPGEDIQRIKTIRSEVTNSADLFIVQTTAAQATLIAEGISEEKIVKWPYWIRPHEAATKETRRKALCTLGLGERDLLILFNGQVEWEEGLLDLLNAIRQLKKSDRALNHRIKLAIYGIGSFANEVKQHSLLLGIDSDVLYLAPSRDSYITLLHAAHCIFVGSQPARDRIDGDAYRLVSAMSYGIPVVSPRTPLIEEIMGKHRLDFCIGSFKSLQSAILKSIESPRIVHNIIQNNKIKIEKFMSVKVKDKMSEPLKRVGIVNHLKKRDLDGQILEVENRIAQKEYVTAISLIEKILGIHQNIPNYHKSNLCRLIGDSFTKLGDPESAKKSYIEAIELDPYSYKSHIGLGTVSLTKANYDISIIQFQKAVELAPNDEMANLGLGLSFQGLDELKEAHKWVMKSLEINPYNTAAIYTLVKIASEREIYGDLEKILKQYLSKHPHDDNMVYTLGGILYKSCKYEEVIDLVQGILKSNPLDSRSQSLIKQAKRAISRVEKSSA